MRVFSLHEKFFITEADQVLSETIYVQMFFDIGYQFGSSSPESLSDEQGKEPSSYWQA